jgi:putative transposase
VGSLHRKIAGQRLNFLHQQSAKPIGRIGLLVTERLAIQPMTANGGRRKRGLNGEVWTRHQGCSCRCCDTKWKKPGRSSGEAPTRRLKPSQTCHCYGRRMKKTLAEWRHRRPCGVVYGRDDNSALMLLHDALTSQELAGCGEAARVASVKHETPPRASAWVE